MSRDSFASMDSVLPFLCSELMDRVDYALAERDVAIENLVVWAELALPILASQTGRADAIVYARLKEAIATGKELTK